MRKPDGKEITKSTTGLTIKDSGITTLGSYSYEVIAVSEAGESEAATTEAMSFGPLNKVPYEYSFSQGSGSWTVKDNNADGDTWIHQSIWDGSAGMAYLSDKNDGDDYIISHQFKFEAGKKYEVSQTVMAYGQTSYGFVLLKDGNVESPVKELANFNEFEKMWQKVTQKFTFSVDESGEYNIAIKATAKKGDEWIYIFDVNIEEGASTNLAAESLTGTAKPQLQKASKYTVKVINNGTEPVSKYTVNLKNAADDAVLATKAIEEGLAPSATNDVELEWTPENKDVTALIGEVVCEGDARESDNQTAKLDIAVADPDPDNLVRIGNEGTTQTKDSPFDFYDTCGAALNIYAQSEINRENGVISKISYPYTNNTEKSGLAVKVYLANTELTTTTAGWIPESELTLVFNGKINIENTTDGELEIPFDKEFNYNGKNLAIMTVANGWSTVYNCAYRTYKSPLDGNNCLSWYSNTDEFDFTQAGKQTDYNNSVNIYIDPQGGTSELSANTVKVYPNPASYQISVDGEFSSLELVDLSGRSVLRTNAEKLDVSNVANGLYLLVITNTDEQSREVVKVKIAH